MLGGETDTQMLSFAGLFCLDISSFFAGNNSLDLAKKVNLTLFDIRDKNKLEKTIKNFKPSIIFHLAAQPLVSESYKNPYQTFDINFRGTLNIIHISINKDLYYHLFYTHTITKDFLI